MGPRKRARILLADDHAEALEQAVRVLGGSYEIAGTASNGQELLEAAVRLDPDVIVLDIAMPVMDGFEAARRLHAAGCRSALVFLTVWEDPDYVEAALALEARGFVVKSRLATDLGPAVAAVLAGRQFVSREMDRDARRGR